MPNKHAAINPRLISVLTGREMAAIGPKPGYDALPGAYTCKVAKRIKRVPPFYKPNLYKLICGHCGAIGSYNVGLVVFHADRWVNDTEYPRGAKRPSLESFFDYLQFVGYFRCNACNGAGLWSEVKPLLPFIVLDKMLHGGLNREEDGYIKGYNELYDGSRPRWSSDAEEQFLLKLQEDPEDSFLWVRLGNLYLKGGRPELAAAAFEQA